MAEFVIDSFPGLAPGIRKAAPGGVTFAKEAVNCDLRGGTVRPFKADSFEASGHNGEIVYFDGQWISGDSNYLPWVLDDYPVLIYKDLLSS